MGCSNTTPLGQAGVPSSPVYAPTAAGYSLLDGMAAAGTISKTNLGILEKYAPATGAFVRNTVVNGVNIPYGVYTIVAPSFSKHLQLRPSAQTTICRTRINSAAAT